VDGLKLEDSLECPISKVYIIF